MNRLKSILRPLTVVLVLTALLLTDVVPVYANTETLRPNAAGDETNCGAYYDGAIHDPDPNVNYTCVDEEASDGNTTYVRGDTASTAWFRDLYNLPAHSGSGTINSVTVYIVARATATPTQTSLKVVCKTNAVIYEEEKTVTTAYATYSKVWTTNPQTGVAWTWAEIDALQIGTSNRRYDAGTAGSTRSTQVYVVVDYTSTAPPTVTTSAATLVEATTARLNGNVTATGGENPTVTVYWGDNDGGQTPASWDFNSAPTSPSQPQGVAAFYKDATGLSTGTTYYFGAKATNSYGTGWGTTQTFLTKPAAPTNVSATDGTYTDKVTITWTKSTGATGYKVYEGSNLLQTLGDVATYDDTAAPAPTITPGTAAASDGTSCDYVTLVLSGESVANGTSRTYKVVAFNATGNSADSATNTGYRGYGTLTYQWQRSAADSDADYSNITGATTDPYNDTGAPANGDGRYYKCVLNATGATQQTSTADRGYRDTIGAPTVVTNAFLGFGGTWAVLSGTITDNGGASVTEVGFDYGLTDAYGSSWTVTGSWTTGSSFVGVVSPLTKATVYHYRAKAYNGTWGYGSDMMVNTEGSATIYEYLNTGGDSDSAHIYGNNWGAHSFTVVSTSHTTTYVRVYIKRTGSPGTVTISLKHATDAGLPTGADLTSATLNGNALSTSYTWYVIEFTETSLEAGSKYAIVIRAVAGDTDNDIQWRAASTGGLANAIACTSTDGGISWSSAAPIDYLFEVWGYPCIDIIKAAVVQGYLEDNDMLFLIYYKNVYPPYYPDDDPRIYFYLQLLGTNGTTLIVQYPVQQWGCKPGSIYLSADSAAGLTAGSGYYLRLYGNFSGNPSDQYQLVSTDWLGSELTYLDQWVLLTAHSIESYYTEVLGTTITLTTTVAEKGEVLNAQGHVIFVTGIPELSSVRPNLFEQAVQYLAPTGVPPEDVFSGAVDWDVAVGSDVATVATDIGTIIGIDGKTIVGLALLGCYLLIAIVVVGKGHVTSGLALAFPFIIIGGVLRVIDIAIIAILGFVMLGLFVWSFWLPR